MRLKHEIDFLSINYFNNFPRFKVKTFFDVSQITFFILITRLDLKINLIMRKLNANCESLLINYFYFYFYFISIKSVNSMIKDFKVVVDKISLLLRNERNNCLLNFENNKNKVFNYLQINFVKFMTKFIIIYVLT